MIRWPSDGATRDSCGRDATFQYTEGGSLVTSTNLASGNSDPRGATSNADGDTLWCSGPPTFGSEQIGAKCCAGPPIFGFADLLS